MVSNGNANAEYLRGMPASDTPAEEIGNCVWRIFSYACAVFVWHFRETVKCHLDAWVFPG